MPVPAPWWQWSLGDGFAQCLAGVNAPLKINSAEGGGTSSAGCHKLLTLADASWLFNILVAKSGSFHERPESTRAISARNRPPGALFLGHHIKTRLNKVRFSCVQRYLQVVLWDVGKRTSVPAVESYPGWWLFLGWGSGKFTGQVALGIHPAVSRCSYNGKNLIWEVHLDVGNGVCANCGVWREKLEGKKVFW